LARGNHGNLARGQPQHLSHCLHSGKKLLFTVPSLALEEGGWSKRAKYSKPSAQLNMREKKNSNGENC